MYTQKRKSYLYIVIDKKKIYIFKIKKIYIYINPLKQFLLRTTQKGIGV